MDELRRLMDEIKVLSGDTDFPAELPLTEEGLLSVATAALDRLEHQRLTAHRQTPTSPRERCSIAELRCTALRATSARLDADLAEVTAQITRLKANPQHKLTPQAIASQLSREIEFSRHLNVKLDLAARLLALQGLSLFELTDDPVLHALIAQREQESLLVQELLANEREIQRLEAALGAVSRS